jgi:hypothetical protein
MRHTTGSSSIGDKLYLENCTDQRVHQLQRPAANHKHKFEQMSNALQADSRTKIAQPPNTTKIWNKRPINQPSSGLFRANKFVRILRNSLENYVLELMNCPARCCCSVLLIARNLRGVIMYWAYIHYVRWTHAFPPFAARCIEGGLCQLYKN